MGRISLARALCTSELLGKFRQVPLLVNKNSRDIGLQVFFSHSR